MIEIDGSVGSAGGQLTRTSLALSTLLQKEVHVFNIRAGRPKPGLRPQHLTALQTLAQICNAEVKGMKIHSEEVTFFPKKISSVQLTANTTTAGSISLLLSQLLPVALKEEIQVRVIGGTDVDFSPPINFLSHVLFPKLKEMNARFQLKLLQRGFYPMGNGRVFFASQPAKLPLKPITITELGELEIIKCFSHSSGLPEHVSTNQAIAAKKYLSEHLGENDFEEKISHSSGRKDTIGSGIDLFACFSSNEVIASNSLGKRGKPATEVGEEAAKKLIKQLETKQPCDFHLTDQLIPFMALAKGKSEIHSTKLTQHTLTNISITEKFLKVKFKVEGELGSPSKISVTGIAFE